MTQSISSRKRSSETNGFSGSRVMSVSMKGRVRGGGIRRRRGIGKKRGRGRGRGRGQQGGSRVGRVGMSRVRLRRRGG